MTYGFQACGPPRVVRVLSLSRLRAIESASGFSPSSRWMRMASMRSASSALTSSRNSLACTAGSSRVAFVNRHPARTVSGADLNRPAGAVEAGRQVAATSAEAVVGQGGVLSFPFGACGTDVDCGLHEFGTSCRSRGWASMDTACDSTTVSVGPP